MIYGNFPPKKKPEHKKSKKSHNKSFKNSFENMSSDRKLPIQSNSLGNNVNIIFKNPNIILSSNNNQFLKNNIIKEKGKGKEKYDKIQIKNTDNPSKEKKVITLNDEELNILEYEIAIIKDKRTYFQYYRKSRIGSPYLIMGAPFFRGWHYLDHGFCKVSVPCKKIFKQKYKVPTLQKSQ